MEEVISNLLFDYNLRNLSNPIMCYNKIHACTSLAYLIYYFFSRGRWKGFFMVQTIIIYIQKYTHNITLLLCIIYKSHSLFLTHSAYLPFNLMKAFDFFDSLESGKLYYDELLDFHEVYVIHAFNELTH